MKRFLGAILILSLTLALATGLFSCQPEKSPEESTDLNALALEVAEEAIPDGELNAAIAKKLLSALTEAEFEKAEIVASLRALKEKGADLMPALIALYESNFTKEHAKASYVALGAIAKAVSPEAAGELFYSVVCSLGESPAYSKEDCRKIGSLVFGLNVDIDESFLSSVLGEGLSSIGAKEINTIFRAVSASLNQAKTISLHAKIFLYNLLNETIDNFAAPEEFTEEQIKTLISFKNYLKELAKTLLDHFEIALTYLSAYFGNASSRLTLGGAYAKTDETLYYGYTYDDWKSTQITKEEYDARSGDYDDYFALEGTAYGYYDGDRFVKISESDVALGEKVYALQVLFRAYSALSDAQKEEFRTFLQKSLSILAKDEGSVMTIFKLTPHEADENARIASLNDLLSALSTVSSFESTDGVTDHERAAANAAIDVYDAFLRGYFPHLF